MSRKQRGGPGSKSDRRFTREDVALLLLGRIANGEFQPGAPLPSQEKLRCSIHPTLSMSTFHGGLALLKERGIIVTQNRQCTLVADPLPHQGVYALTLPVAPSGMPASNLFRVLRTVAESLSRKKNGIQFRIFENTAHGRIGITAVQALEQAIRWREVQGVLFTSNLHHPARHQIFQRNWVPLAALIGWSGEAPSMPPMPHLVDPPDLSDSFMGKALERLREVGKRRVAVIRLHGGPAYEIHGATYWDNWRKAIEACGLSTEPDWLVESAVSTGRTVGRFLTEIDPGPEAIIIEDDTLTPYVTTGIAEGPSPRPLVISKAHFPVLPESHVPAHFLGWDIEAMLQWGLRQLQDPAAQTANAIDWDWVPDGSGNWFDSNNWAPSDTETLLAWPNDDAHTVFINRALTGDATITIDLSAIGDPSFVRTESLTIGDPNHTYTLAGGQFRTANGITIADNSTVIIESDWLQTGKTISGGAGSLLIMSGDINRDGGPGVTISGGLTMRFSGTMAFPSGARHLAVGAGSTLEIAKNGTINTGGEINLSSHSSLGGTLTVHGGDRVITDGVSTHLNTTIDLSPGNLTVGGVHFNGQTVVSSARVTIRDGVFTSTGDVQYSMGTNASTNGFIELDNATYILSGEGNTYTVNSGDGWVNDVTFRAVSGSSGTFVMNNADGSATGSGNNLVIDENITLRGNGFTQSTLVAMNGSTVRPGNSVGDLTVGDAVFDGGSTLFIDIINDISSSLLVGDMTIEEGTTLTLSIVGSLLSPQTLVAYSGTLSGFFDTEDFALPDGWTLDYGTGSNSTISVVPEPGLFALFSGLLALGLVFLRRRN